MKPQLLTTTIPADVRGWWASEKFDGVRAIWNGRSLHYRSGRAINAPEWFTRGLPAGIRLDGELWMGRGKFDDLVSAIQKKGSDWNGIRFMIFDLAAPGGFEERLDRASTRLAPTPARLGADRNPPIPLSEPRRTSLSARARNRGTPAAKDSSSAGHAPNTAPGDPRTR
jgi:ATP-dependent DNA ligase